MIIPKEFDLSKLSFSDFITSISSIPPKYHASLIINTIWIREDITEKEKTLFLIEVLKTSKSLKAKNVAGILFEEKYNVNWDPFYFQPIYDKWDKTKDTIK